MDAYEGQDRDRLAAAAESALPLLDRALETTSREGETWRELQRQRGFVLGVLGRLEESREAFAAVQAGAWLDPSFLSLRFDAAAFAEDHLGMLEVIEALVRLQGDAPDGAVANLAEENVGSLYRRLVDRPELSARFAEALITADWNRDAAPGARDWIIVRAMQNRFLNGDEAGAIRLLDRVESPQALIATLIQNRYAGLWPIIERRVGTDLARIAAFYEETLARAHAADPENVSIIELYALHLSETGQHAEVLTLVTPITDDATRLDAAGERGFWLINHAAYAEMALGRGDAALARMERLIARGFEAGPELISMAINRILMLRSLGQYEQALAEAEALAVRTETGNLASDYGKMFIWSAAACSAHALGQDETAARWRARVEANPEANEKAALLTYRCMNDMAAAEAFVIERLASDDPTAMLKEFQHSTVSSRLSPADEELRRRFEALRAQPAVRAALERVGRVLEFAISVS